jgi:hypothetical protein
LQLISNAIENSYVSLSIIVSICSIFSICFGYLA